jgi:hypothetical protein
MKQHSYRITVEHISDAHGKPVAREPLVFTARNHDDLLQIVARTRRRARLDVDDSAAMAIGLKLLSEIVLEHRDEAPFSDLREPLGAFIQQLKAAPATSQDVDAGWLVG